MSKYRVTVRITSTKEISVYARDEEAAQDKAEEIVLKWAGVDEVEAIDAEREDE